MVDSGRELILTCRSWQEAQDKADALLEKQLITSAEFVKVKADEIKLLLQVPIDSPLMVNS